MIDRHTGAGREARRDNYDAQARARQPSRRVLSTGYRHDSEAHHEARMKLSAERRREIAAMGGRARAAVLHGAREKRKRQLRERLTR